MKQNVPEFKEQVETFKKRQQQVLKSKPIWDECQRLETEEIPRLKARKDELEETVEKLTDENDGLTMIVSEVETNVQTIQKNQSNVAVYENSRKEIKRFDDSIAKIEKHRDAEAKSNDEVTNFIFEFAIDILFLSSNQSPFPLAL